MTNEKNREAVRKYREKNRDKINERARQYYAANKDMLLERCKTYRASPDYNEKQRRWSREDRRQNPEKSLHRSCRKRSLKSGLDFDIDISDIVIPEKCPILEEPLMYCGPDRLYWPTVDRIDNTKGYVKGNVRVISYKANMMKCDMLLWQVENLIAYMKGE